MLFSKFMDLWFNCAVGAIGLEPGDEVIVTPWTVVATYRNPSLERYSVLLMTPNF